VRLCARGALLSTSVVHIHYIVHHQTKLEKKPHHCCAPVLLWVFINGLSTCGACVVWARHKQCWLSCEHGGWMKPGEKLCLRWPERWDSQSIWWVIWPGAPDLTVGQAWATQGPYLLTGSEYQKSRDKPGIKTLVNFEIFNSVWLQNTTIIIFSDYWHFSGIFNLAFSRSNHGRRLSFPRFPLLFPPFLHGQKPLVLTLLVSLSWVRWVKYTQKPHKRS